MAEEYEKHINKHNVIQQAYPDLCISADDSAWDALLEIHEYTDGKQFIFILDEWDYIFHRDYVTDEDKKDYII